MTARLVGVASLRDSSPDWLTLLRAAGAMESYLRASTRASSPDEIASFLLLDRAFHVRYHSLAVADHCLEELSKVTRVPKR